MSRLTRLWLICVLVGFALSAAIAIGLAAATDKYAFTLFML